MEAFSQMDSQPLFSEEPGLMPDVGHAALTLAVELEGAAEAEALIAASASGNLVNMNEQRQKLGLRLLERYDIENYRRWKRPNRHDR